MPEERRGDYINLHQAMGQALKPLEEKVDEVKDRVINLERSIQGVNGEPGIKTRIAVLETKIALPIWISAAVAFAAISAVVSKVLGAW